MNMGLRLRTERFEEGRGTGSGQIIGGAYGEKDAVG